MYSESKYPKTIKITQAKNLNYKNMELSKLNVQKFSVQEMTKLGGGQYFKPTIDGTYLQNERRFALGKNTVVPKQKSFFDQFCALFF